ncbi:MAG: DJ-1 family glyoxalase III [Thermodesulfobacteriota bacterium]
MKRILMPLAPGFEEIEALAVVDILRRAGADVVTAGTVEGPITGRNKIRVLADKGLDEALTEGFDIIVLPGGAEGTRHLKEDRRIKKVLQGYSEEKKLIAAICAAPTVLAAAGLTKGRTITSHPGVHEELKNENLSEERVVVDNNIITSQGPGTAIEFAFCLVTILFGREKTEEVNAGVLARI